MRDVAPSREMIHVSPPMSQASHRPPGDHLSRPMVGPKPSSSPAGLADDGRRAGVEIDDGDASFGAGDELPSAFWTAPADGDAATVRRDADPLEAAIRGARSDRLVVEVDAPDRLAALRRRSRTASPATSRSGRPLRHRLPGPPPLTGRPAREPPRRRPRTSRCRRRRPSTTDPRASHPTPSRPSERGAPSARLTQDRSPDPSSAVSLATNSSPDESGAQANQPTGRVTRSRRSVPSGRTIDRPGDARKAIHWPSGDHRGFRSGPR